MKNKFLFYPADDEQFRQELKIKKCVFCEIWENDQLINVFERDCTRGWGVTNSRETQMLTHPKIRGLYYNVQIYTWIPAANDTLEKYLRPDKNLFGI